MEVQVIAVWDLDKVLEDTKALLIDLREREMYEKGHIPGAISVQYEENLMCFQLPTVSAPSATLPFHSPLM